ncbi:MAG: 30S ribosomal protein S6e [Candidatus Aenigmatarchaeota archaeon]|nr:MAG: 30S ribosomal protein S6e [Candidatus Aenigmarchaeota archaeon]
MAFRTVVSTKDGKAFQKEVEAPSLVGLKIGEKVDGSLVGLNGYTLEITGGSDKEGFPMRRDLPGLARKKILLTGGSGYNAPQSGVRKRKSVRGNTVSELIIQVNLKVITAGEKPVHELWGITPKPPKEKWKAPEGEAKPAPEEKT